MFKSFTSFRIKCQPSLLPNLPTNPLQDCALSHMWYMLPTKLDLAKLCRDGRQFNLDIYKRTIWLLNIQDYIVHKSEFRELANEECWEYLNLDGWVAVKAGLEPCFSWTKAQVRKRLMKLPQPMNHLSYQS